MASESKGGDTAGDVPGGSEAAPAAPSAAESGGGAGGSSGDSAGPPALPVPLTLDAHLAVWDHDIEKLRTICDAAKEDPPDSNRLEVRDARGRTPLLLAYSLNYLEAAEVLIAAGADAKTRLLGGWEAIEVAALSANPALVRTAVIGMLSETDRAFDRRIPKLFDTLESVPDFSLTMEWQFASWVPLVSRLLPSDTLRIWKRGSSMRLDGTLLGMNGLKWERGNLTFLFMGRHSQKPGEIIVMDRDRKTCGSLRRAFIDPRDSEVQAWVQGTLTKPIKETDWMSREMTLSRSAKGGWFGGGGTPTTTKIGDFEDCDMYLMSNLRQTILTHPAVFKKLDLSDWWREEYVMRPGRDGIPDDKDRALAEELREARAQALSKVRQKRAAEAGTAGAATSAAKPKDATERAVTEAELESYYDDDFTPDPKGLEGLLSALTTLKDTADVSAPEVEVVAAGDMGVGAKFETMTFDEYFNVEPDLSGRLSTHGRYVTIPHKKISAEGHAESRNVVHFAQKILKKEQKTTNNIQVAFNKDFPISTEAMLAVAEVMTRTQSHFKNLKHFFESKFPAEAGFPVQFQLPVFPTVSATVTFAKCRAVSPHPNMFMVPEEYEMGAYVDRSFLKQV